MNNTTDLHQPSSLACPPTYDDIDERALELWECYHRPEGRDEEIWLQAERQLLGLEPLVNPPDPAALPAHVFDQTPSREKTRTRLEQAIIAQTAAAHAA